MNNPNYVGPDIIKESFDVLAKAVYTLQGISPIPNSEPIARTEPIVHPEYPKCVATHIWEISEGVFDFSDETENFSGTQYPTIEAAQAALKDYCAGMPNGKKAGERCIHLQDSLCSLFGLPTRPQVCSSFQANEDICGSTYEESAKKIQWYERMTS